ncbi:MAG: hypothetical protein DDT29_02375 [Dehalococcoidia bacterium]|nr:hypothetical protein [Bacillota bacterium]
MVYKIGDEVVDTHALDVPGIVRAKYKGHYLVEFPGTAKWQRFTHAITKELLPCNSPLLEEIKILYQRMQELEKQANELYDQKKRILKQR